MTHHYFYHRHRHHIVDLPLERSHLARAFALFDSGSRFVKAGQLPAWSPRTQQVLRDFFLAQTQAMLFMYPEATYLSNPLNMFGRCGCYYYTN